MNKGAGRESKETTPPAFAETTPQRTYEVYDRNTQLFSDIQRSIGGLTEAVKNLQDTVGKHDTKLDGIGKKIFAAEVIISIVGAGLLAFFALVLNSLGKIISILAPLLQK